MKPLVTTAIFLICLALAPFTAAQELNRSPDIPCAPHDRIIGDYTKNGFVMFARGVTDGGRMHEMMRRDDIVILLVTYARRTMVSVGGGFTVPIQAGGTCLQTVYEGWFLIKPENDV
jgi:hypothetical protein